MPMLLLDRELATGLMKLACAILREHFCYDLECAEEFCECYADRVNGEYDHFVLDAEDDFLTLLQYDMQARLQFTAEFCGFHLMRTLDEDFYFEAQEMKHFETFMIKYLRE